MSRSDICEVLSHCQWSDEGSYLGEISKSVGFPAIVKVTRGQYQNVGQPNFSNPSLVSHLLLLSGGKNCSIAAQCVKFKSSRQRVVPFGPTLAIPQGYEGHFEILNEDGKSVPSLLTVSDLARKLPESFLVRESIKGYKPSSSNCSTGPIDCHYIKSSAGSDSLSISTGSSGSEPQLTLNSSKSNESNSNLAPNLLPLPTLPNKGVYQHRVSDKCRTIQVGETLMLLGEVTVPLGKSKFSRYLHCLDGKGQMIYLSLSQKGKFSPLARPESISGVHTTKNIFTKRYPLMVRLVDGKQPTPVSKSSFKFAPELRLFSLIQEDHLIFCMPLSQSSKESKNILPLPLTVPLKFQICKNMTKIEESKEFFRIRERMQFQVDHAKNHIQIYDINLKKELRFDGSQWKPYAPPIFLSNGGEIPLKSSEKPNSDHTHPSSTYEIPDLQDYEEIDQIYDFVRGIKPTGNSKTTRNTTDSEKICKNSTKICQKTDLMKGTKCEKAWKFEKNSQKCEKNDENRLKKQASLEVLDDLHQDYKPEPPPIETIPTSRPKFENLHQNLVEKKYEIDGEISPKKSKNIWANGRRKNCPNSNQNQNNLTNNLTNSSSSSDAKDQNGVKKHLYIKHNNGFIDHSNHGAGLSGSPANRIIFRRSPIFDCRYKSMNDLNLKNSGGNFNNSSLESNDSGSHRIPRFYQHNQHNQNQQNFQNHQHFHHQHQQNSHNIPLNIKNRPRIFRPKSLNNILAGSLADGDLINVNFNNSNKLGGKKNGGKIDLVVPSHIHAVNMAGRTRGSLATPPTTLFL